ncbi:hypothetical protein ACS5PU_06700 [Pedobacter sp. GSP4]|uniref:hypothetical protein n=1 Tax=Pedobacter sp. GSP4 TaxID=3453716 RepID=UPI003EEB59FE
MSNTESGFAKNAANLKDLIIRLKTLGDDYQPPQPKFSIDDLEQLSKSAEDATRAVSQVLPVYSKAVDDQELIFKPFSSLITRSYNYLKAAINNPAELQTAKTLADKLRGIGKKNTTAEEASLRINARVSYDARVENFKQYLDVLITSKVYQPVETDISIASFQNLLSSMEANITAVALAKTPVDDARKKRFTIFYAEQIGLIDIVLGVKNYIKASLKDDHPQRKHILALTFTRMNA